MNRSDSITELAKSLCKAQAVMGTATRDKVNPAFKSKYADLAAVWEAIRKPLTDNGIAVAQCCTQASGQVSVETVLLHNSGEWMSEVLTVPMVKMDSFSLGSAISYGRRYALMAMLGVAADDDDGVAAANGKAEPTTAWTRELQDLAGEAATTGMVTYKAWWESLSKETRAVLATTREHQGFKATAIKVDTVALAAAAKGDL